MEYVTVKPLNYNKQNIFFLAETLAKKLSFIPGADIKQFVTSIGGRIIYTEASIEEEPDSIVIASKNDFAIFISVFTSSLRDNFTIAHELGHYFLHYIGVANGEGKMKATRAISDEPQLKRAEVEANWFAAGFLMPEEEFRKQWENNAGDISALSEHFSVSSSAIKIRSQDLKLT